VSTDAKELGLQAGVERATLCLVAVLAGAELVSGLGWLDNSNVFSPELLVSDCEMAEEVRQIARGAQFDAESLALEIIERVGPGGHFLEQDHTLRNFRRVVWYPRLWERSARMPEPGPEQQLRQRIRRRIADLIEGHRPPPIAPATRKALDELLA
jgi:trimethylamine--corrinoid protein Co-methyltransferase